MMSIVYICNRMFTPPFLGGDFGGLRCCLSLLTWSVLLVGSLTQAANWNWRSSSNNFSLPGMYRIILGTWCLEYWYISILVPPCTRCCPASNYRMFWRSQTTLTMAGRYWPVTGPPPHQGEVPTVEARIWTPGT